MIDVTQFCSLADTREYLLKPWRCEQGIAASNGHVLVLVSDDGGEYQPEPESFKGKIAEFETKFTGGPEWIDVVSIQLGDSGICKYCRGRGCNYVVECDECDGDGDFIHGSHTYDCKECDGDGTILCSKDSDGAKRVSCFNCDATGRGFQPVQVGNSFAQGRYLEKLAKLPNCQIAPDGDKAMPFVFDGGRGWLMPCRG